jgi:hypothetical protein
MGGKHQPVGSTRVAPNGYHYTKVSDLPARKLSPGQSNWRLTHHIVAEEKILKRPLLPDERVVFVNKNNRLDLRAENIRVEKKKGKTREAAVAALRAKYEDIRAQLIEMGEEVS